MDPNQRVITIHRSTSTAHRLYHYDGPCNDVHGHNLTWEVDVAVKMSSDDPSNMPIDFKDLTDIIDKLDHATIVNSEDPISGHEHLFGNLVVFDGDPTCEHVSKWMAQKLYEASLAIEYVEVELTETDSYTVISRYSGE